MTKRFSTSLAALALGAMMPWQAADAQEAPAPAGYDALAGQAGERAGDPEFDYRLGIAALDAGHYGEAVIALQPGQELDFTSSAE